MDPAPPVPRDPVTHRRELARFAGFLGAVVFLGGATYLVPQAQALRPWLPGEDVPLAHLVLPDGQEVQEDAWGDLVEVPAAEAVLVATAPPAPEDPAARLPVRPPAVPTAVDDPGALEPWFRALAQAEAGAPGVVVRALHWGDSTIAADGITSQVRARLQARFGDGGPGYLAVHTDPRWQLRHGVLRSTKGEWSSNELTHGGATSSRYGLGGIVSTVTGEGTASLGGVKLGDQRQPLHRFQVFYQHQPEGGTLSMAPKGVRGASVRTASERTYDGFRDLEAPEGAPWVWLKAHGDGPVTVYGVALETSGPGITWEPLGVAGASIGSMLAHQGASHIRGQVEHRAPHLIVYQTGGNELSYPGLHKDDGIQYRESYLKVLSRLREGAPEAACLLVGPLDQGTRVRGEVVSKPTLPTMIEAQRKVAREAGCAFWDARHAMGGEGAFARWLTHQPRYAWTDLMHLTDQGLDLVGDSLADALLDAYDQWLLAHPEATALPAPAPEVEVVPEVPAG